VNSSQKQFWLFQELNEKSDLLKPLTELPKVGKIYAALYTESLQAHYYRAKVVECFHSRKSKDIIIQVGCGN
jgi:hypothetical protein